MKRISLILGTLLFLLNSSCTKFEEIRAKMGRGPQSAAETGKAFSTIQLKKADLDGKLNWRGVVRSAKRIEIRADKKVKIAKVMVKNFQRVQKGELLFAVDRTEQESKKAELNDRRNAMKLEMESTRVKFEHTAKVMDRKRTLLKQSIIPQKEFDGVQRDYRLAQTELRAKQLETEKIDREMAELEEQIKTSNFYAPMDGTVSGVLNVDGETEVSAGQLLAVTSDPKDLALWVQVEETNIHRINLELPADVKLDSIPGKVFKGKIREMSVNASADSGAGQMKTYNVAISFDPGWGKVREGFDGEATVVYAHKEKVISVPLGAIFYFDGKNTVIVSESAGAPGKPRAIQTGIKTVDEAEVTEGLKEGEYITLKPDENAQL